MPVHIKIFANCKSLVPLCWQLLLWFTWNVRWLQIESITASLSCPGERRQQQHQHWFCFPSPFPHSTRAVCSDKAGYSAEHGLDTWRVNQYLDFIAMLAKSHVKGSETKAMWKISLFVAAFVINTTWLWRILGSHISLWEQADKSSQTKVKAKLTTWTCHKSCFQKKTFTHMS